MKKNLNDPSSLALLRTALTWNHLSQILFGISAIGIVGLIARFYGASALGYFSFINAIFIVLTQVATAGIHNSVLVQLANQNKPKSEQSVILFSAIALVVLINLPLCLFLYIYSYELSEFFQIDDIEIGLAFLAPAIFFFSINKIILFSFNATKKVRMFSVGQSSRYILILVSVLGGTLASLEPKWLASSFLIAELMVFTTISFYTLKLYKPTIKISKKWLRKHLSYGLKGAGSGFFITLNLNVDVLILGLFVSQTELGGYSLVALIVVGIYHLLTAVRVSFNPFLANLISQNQLQELSRLIIKARRYIFAAIALLICTATILIPITISNLAAPNDFKNSFILFLILAPGVIIYSLFFPFDQILAMGNRPAQQSLFNLQVLFANLFLNLILIYWLGSIGAAIATSVVSTIIAPILLRFLVLQNIGVDLFFPSTKTEYPSGN